MPRVKLAKPHLDVGLFTAAFDPQRSFWTETVGVTYDHMLKLGGGMQQHRFDVHGSVLKVNHARDPMAPTPSSGIVGVRIARVGLSAPRALQDPDGNRVTLVPPGHEGVVGIEIELRVNDRAAHEQFWREVMQFESAAKGVYRCGDSQVRVIEEARVDRADTWRAPGWRYMTVQITDVMREHEGVLARGGTEGGAPRRLGDTAAISFVRDPDGNYIELSQRASLLGGLHGELPTQVGLQPDAR